MNMHSYIEGVVGKHYRWSPTYSLTNCEHRGLLQPARTRPLGLIAAPDPRLGGMAAGSV